MPDSATGGRLPGRTGHRVVVLPTTKLGRWALALAVSNVVLVLAWSILPGGAALGFACGLAGGSPGSWRSSATKSGHWRCTPRSCRSRWWWRSCWQSC